MPDPFMMLRTPQSPWDKPAIRSSNPWGFTSTNSSSLASPSQPSSPTTVNDSASSHSELLHSSGHFESQAVIHTAELGHRLLERRDAGSHLNPHADTTDDAQTQSSDFNTAPDPAPRKPLGGSMGIVAPANYPRFRR